MHLKLKFHDCDFSMPIQDALECFWGYIKDNNGKYFSKAKIEFIDTGEAILS